MKTTKAYVAVLITGYTTKGKKQVPSFTTIAVNATSWKAARVETRKMAKTAGFQWVNVMVSKNGGTAPIFEVKPIPKPAKIRNMEKYEGTIVVFDHVDFKTGQYKGTFWGKIEGIDEYGFPHIRTSVNLYESVNPNRITATTFAKEIAPN